MASPTNDHDLAVEILEATRTLVEIAAESSGTDSRQHV
jgi:hypothetical protein